MKVDAISFIGFVVMADTRLVSEKPLSFESDLDLDFFPFICFFLVMADTRFLSGKPLTSDCELGLGGRT